jgi:hypothetical protein
MLEKYAVEFLTRYWYPRMYFNYGILGSQYWICRTRKGSGSTMKWQFFSSEITFLRVKVLVYFKFLRVLWLKTQTNLLVRLNLQWSYNL